MLGLMQQVHSAPPSGLAGVSRAPLLGATLSPYSAANVSDFLAACRADQNACVAEVGNALMNKIRLDGTSGICISSTDYAAKVPTWLGAHQDTFKMPPEEGIYLALQSLYPCN